MDNDWIIAIFVIVTVSAGYYLVKNNQHLWHSGYDEGFRDAFDLINKYDEDFDNDKILVLLKKAIKPVIKEHKRYNRGDLKRIDECQTLDELRKVVTEIMRRK